MMIRFKDFLADPVNACAKGYEPSLVDCMALFCSWVSFKNTRHVLNDWYELLTEPSLVQLPKELVLVLLGTMLYISIPLLFWVYGLYFYIELPYVVKRRKEAIRRIDEELSR